MRSRDLFTTVRTEGGLLPADFLQRIASGDRTLAGLTPESYHLAENERINEATNRAWNRLVGAWAAFKAAREKLESGDLGTTATRERWLLVLFQELGYGRLVASKTIEIAGKGYPISHSWNHTPIHLVGCNVELDRRTKGAKGAAGASPHGLVQELLNRSEECLWGIASNGLCLRLLRDNVSLTRQAYVELDLEAMMEGEVYSDFVLLWVLYHQSRVEADKPEECWLERWSAAAREQGTRALDRLRVGVEAAIEALGKGFLAHPRNADLREKLRAGALDKQDYYRQLLRLVYRLLFLFVAEDRDLLLDPSAGQAAKERYWRFYSTVRLRRLAQRRRGSPHSDLYQGLRVVMEKLGTDTGCATLGLPALGSFLWSRASLPDLETAEIPNADFLDAIRAIAFTIDGKVLRVIDYKNLAAEELGSVYESLLELHPEISAEAAMFRLTTAGGHERKTTGSYYTPESLVQCLLDSALDPVLDVASRRSDPEKAILALKVCDPACGSGHFLIAAAHRIAKRLAAVRTGDDEPSPDATRHALRDVIGHCIYGVDLNPMAVELCKVSLWMEALEPGRPLSFLEHRVLRGNSLLGSTPELIGKGIPDEAFQSIEGDDKEIVKSLKKRNKQERDGQMLLFQEVIADAAADYVKLGGQVRRIDDLDDASIIAIREKEEHYRRLAESPEYHKARLAADAWCAAFVWRKTKDSPPAITHDVFLKLQRNPEAVPLEVRKEIARISEEYQFFQWNLAFPDVFRSTTSGRGFDVVAGNPPWERVKLQEREFFANSRPDIADAATAAIRRRLITQLATEDHALFEAYEDALRRAEAESTFTRNSARFPHGASGDTNTYPLFIELAASLIQEKGRVGLIVKTGILADYSMREFFDHLVETGRLISAFDFSNANLIFPAVVANERFTLLTVAGPNCNSGAIIISVLNEDVADLRIPNNVWRLSREEIRLINPNTHTCPLFQTAPDADLVSAIYRRHPVLVREREADGNRWGASYFTMFHMTNDSPLFRDSETLQSQSTQPPGPVWQTTDGNYVALLEGKLYDLFDHRHGTFEGVPRESRFGIKAEPNHPSIAQKQSANTYCLPRYWVPTDQVRSRYSDRLGFQPSGVLTFRDVCRTHTDLRTVRACICPPLGAGNKAPLFLFPNTDPVEHALRSALLCANLGALALDYVARQKFSGGSLNKFIIIQFPVIDRGTYDEPCAWGGALGVSPHTVTHSFTSWLMPRILELTYTAWDLGPFAQDCGYDGPPFRWDEQRRPLLRAELDAAFFHLYGLKRDNVAYILETFPILKRKDIEKHGDYRTKLVILDIYDRMQRAIETGEPYQTVLDPPPADPRVAHPPKEDSRRKVIGDLAAKVRAIESKTKVGNGFAIRLPMYDLRAAAGPFDESQAVGAAKQVLVRASQPYEQGPGRFYFVAQVTGRSMEPEIPDGAYCLFRRPANPRSGARVLVRRQQPEDAERGGRFVVKEYRQGEQGGPAQFKSLNPKFPTFYAVEDDIIDAEWVETVECIEGTDAEARQ